MNFEKIEQAYTYLLENTQSIQNELSTNFYDALIEQNAMYLDGKTDLDIVKNNSKKLKELGLSKEEWHRAYQFLFMKAAQTEPLQANHQFTPDAIGFIITFLIDQLAKSDQLDVLEVGSGTGNLAETIVNNSRLTIDYLGLEVDDLLIDLSASIADVMESSVVFAQGDAVRPQVLKESDLIVSDLPIGFYPDDAIAQRYQVASSKGLQEVLVSPFLTCRINIHTNHFGFWQKFRQLIIGLLCPSPIITNLTTLTVRADMWYCFLKITIVTIHGLGIHVQGK